MKKLLKFTAWGLLAVILTVAIGAVVALRGSLPQLEGELAAPVSAAVTVTRDARGVASLAGGSREDIGYALGFLHGQERFFQMDLLRRSSAGELSALFGPLSLQLDRDKRVHRFRARARAAVARLPGEHRALLEHYARGVNAGVEALSVRPFEYLLVGEAPAPWRPEDSLLVVVAMYFDLQNRMDDKDYMLERLAQLIDEPWFDFINADGGRFDASLFDDHYPEPELPDTELAAKLPDTLPAPHQQPELPAPRGSNNWAVSGALTEHGAALVANDMHLGLRLPHIWFRAGWQLPDGRTVQGVNLPGTPLIVAGSNGAVAWGFTNSYIDTMDVLRLQRGADGQLRTRDGAAVATTTHRERIVVKGAADETLEVLETPYGPVVAEDADGAPLVLQWTAHRPAGLNTEIMAMEEYQTVEEVLAYAPAWGMPNQNLVVGDSRGSIGWTITGPLPHRSAYRQGLVDTPWLGLRPGNERPRVMNPPSGRIWTANSRVVDRDFSDAAGDGSYALGARAQQIRDALLARQRFNEAGFMAIATDNRALFLTRWYQQLQRELDSEAHRDSAAAETIARALADWVGRAEADNTAHLAVSRFRTQFHAHTLARLYAEATRAQPRENRMRLMDEYALWALASQKPANALLPDQANWDEVMAAVLDAVAADISGADGGIKRWGEHNTLKMAHPFARLLPWLAGPLSMPAVGLAGDDYMPNVLRSAGSNVSERLFVAPGQEHTAVLHMPGGQSGHPLSPFWDAGHEDWLQHRPTPLQAGPAAWTLRFTPAE